MNIKEPQPGENLAGASENGFPGGITDFRYAPKAEFGQEVYAPPALKAPQSAITERHHPHLRLVPSSRRQPPLRVPVRICASGTILAGRSREFSLSPTQLHELLVTAERIERRVQA
jgi:hypothetical protein